MRDNNNEIKITLSDLENFIHSFVESTKEYVYIRPEDRLIILRPNRVHHLNRTAVKILKYTYDNHPAKIEPLITELSQKHKKSQEELISDIYKLFVSLSALLDDRMLDAPSVKFHKFLSHEIKFPVISEIALTYRCQNRCVFCYASANERPEKTLEMTTDQVKIVIDKIIDQAKVPTLSFTGGEPTLRRDIHELISYATSKGIRTNLITNGIICANEKFVQKLKDVGLKSAQVSLEASDASLHNKIVKNKGAFQATIKGVKNLADAGIHTHTNTTLCGENLNKTSELIDYLCSLGKEYFSMNMVIRTGGGIDNEGIFPGYTKIGEALPDILKYARQKGIKPVWYSPTPYCIFNPVTHNLGSKSCAAVAGLLSVDPTGEVLPCSSFSTGVGNLIKEDFDIIWNRRESLYWRKKEFLPPGCKKCSLKDICCGGCPLYWDAEGGFDEIRPFWENKKPFEVFWKLRRKYIGRTFGVHAKNIKKPGICNKKRG